MGVADATVWQTLARLYGAVFACALCIPPLCAFPTLLGVQSIFVSLAFGAVGIGAAGVLFVLVDAQVEQWFIARRFNQGDDRYRRQEEPGRR